MASVKGERERAKHLRLGDNVGGGGAGVAVVAADELRELITEAVSAAIGGGRPALLDRTELALALDCSPGFVDKLRRQGMPCVYLGDSPRFELDRCLEWLRGRTAA